jgi:minimal PKS chain-length factor (CLF/KS beta)
MSVITASSSGGNELAQKEMQNLWGKGPVFVGAYQSIGSFCAAATAQISIKYGMEGSPGVVTVESAGGLEALAHARRAIRRGIDVVVCGGAEASITPFALTAQGVTGNLSSAQDPAAGYRPFDVGADGYVPGEGGAILLVEDLEHAGQRAAPRVYGEILGHAATHDAYHYARPAPDGQQLGRAMCLAIENAGITPDEIDVVFADAAGTPEGDAAEVKAIKEVFGQRSQQVPVVAPKSMIGRLAAGGASLDVAAALLAIRDGCIPPIVNLDQPVEGYGLCFVRGEARNKPIDTVLVNARGSGGFNSALVLRRVL